ncbi:hypothetical protein GALMADRAFT_65531 [Galerina marginata CBS 339.88]|uniref:Killer toxin Kp4 domain-containing protein n=1 Tax=Galerina marginata (strain CBS 339.88) TaxID=685588 RepID=A0A067T3P0_GALM3|nr:hypothetical protein GALMADRAFT_65531 [Galerina marginata CBS 339.88]
MRTSISFITLIAFVAGAASALNLNNGVSTVSVEVGPDNVAARSALFERDTFNCKGSSRCSNSQGFKNQCLSAFNLIEDTIYRPGGGGASGVCSGNCGIFIQSTPGNNCPVNIDGQNLRNAYNLIRGAGCQACGSDVNGECEVTINFVTGC